MQIAFYKGTKSGIAGLFNRLVRWWTGGQYSHCELILGAASGLVPALCASASNLDHGVRTKTIALDPARWDIFEVGGDADRVAAWFKRHDGQPYDLLGLFGFVGRRQDGDPGKWFCSEACAAALGLHEPWRYCPNTLAAVLRGLRPLTGSADLEFFPTLDKGR